jgi:hypothetical protein
MLTDRDDLVSVALHEQGHAWAAIHHGDPCPRVHVYRDPDLVRFAGMCWPSIGFPRPIWRTVALAGAVTQLVRIFPDITADDAFYKLLSRRPIALTDGDAAGAYGFDRVDVDRTLAVVRHRWRDIESSAIALATDTADRLAGTA